ncbi:hypothetical protein [Streptomyces showdoensis]|uniref:Uncharacterized protein n=1 Tax=Streptomyces showdoensis TaxID=68268 RepID=A0A2P2GVT1_STREW|nr:hypothetical protein [Streptomyces showdoensis]KKZ75604.1 hypothetical protein VO63_01920 [Streptomyces showdoensis]
MPKHHRRATGERTRRRTAAGLLSFGALAATFLTTALHPAAPPAPDREPATLTSVSSGEAQLSRD